MTNLLSNLYERSPVLFFSVLSLTWLMSIDGMRFIFRGTRDYLVMTLNCAALAARVAATIAALAALFSGTAFFVTLAAWVGGVRPFKRRV
jgi:fatty acid desaturase